MKIIAVPLLFTVLVMQGMATPVNIPLEGINDYANSITMDIPYAITSSSAAFSTEHVYEVAIKGTLSNAPWTVFVDLKSFEAARPSDPINASADTNIQYFQSKNMHLVSDFVGQNKNYGLYREQEFGWADGGYMSERTFMLDKNHVAFVMSIFDKETTTKMFDSIMPGTSNSMFAS